MKKAARLLIALLLTLLCACGDTAAPPEQTAPPEQPAAPAAVPEVCRRYYDYAALAVIAPDDSKLPLASAASHGAPEYLPLWHQGEYGQLAAGGEGWTVPELTDGRASEEGAYGRFCWNGERYHCIHVKADNSYVPSLCSTSGGILWLELSGNCWADTGWDEVGSFGGFDTVVITGSGTLSLSQQLEGGAGKEALPALIIDGVDVTCPSVELVGNTAPDTANLLLLSGSLTADRATVSGDACIAGGTASIGLLLDCPYLVCRGGETTLREGWSFVDESDAAPPTVLLTGGTLTADVWMPENIVYQLWEGTITARGVRYWPETHVLSDTVTIVDPLDTEAADE